MYENMYINSRCCTLSYLYVRFLLLLLKKSEENTFDIHPCFVHQYLKLTNSVLCNDKKLMHDYCKLYKDTLIALKKHQIKKLCCYAINNFKDSFSMYEKLPLTDNLIRAIYLHLHYENMFTKKIYFPDTSSFVKNIKDLDQNNFDEVISLLTNHHALFKLQYKTNSIDSINAPYLNIDNVLNYLETLKDVIVSDTWDIDNKCLVNFITILYLLYIPSGLCIASLDELYEMYIKDCSFYYRKAIQRVREYSGFPYEAGLFIEEFDINKVCSNLYAYRESHGIRADSLIEKVFVLKYFLNNANEIL